MDGFKEFKIYAFADESGDALSAQIDAMTRNSLDGLEIRGIDGQNVSDITTEKARDIKKRLDDRGLRVWSVGSPIGKISITDPFAPHLDKFRHTLEVCKELGADVIRLFSFFIPEGADHGVYRDEVMTRLTAFCEAAQGSGVVLCHENEKCIYGDIASRCAEIHECVPALRAVFDPANFIQCGQDTLEAWELLSKYVDYLHIKDAMADGRVVPAGGGIGNVPYIIDEYKKQGGTVLTVEPHLNVFKGLSDLERKGARSSVSEFAYPTPEAAFDAAVAALREIIGGGI